MKKILLLLTLSAITNIAFAQDNIVLKNGDEINAKILEVGESNIKYKKFNNLDGPIYTKAKDEIFMIKYSNGEKDVLTSNISNLNNINKKISNSNKKNAVIGGTGHFIFESGFENDNFYSTSNLSLMLSIGGYLTENFVIGGVIGGSSSTIGSSNSAVTTSLLGAFIRGYHNDFYSQLGYTVSKDINALTTGIGYRIYLNDSESVSLNPSIVYYTRTYTEIDIKQSGILGGFSIEIHL